MMSILAAIIAVIVFANPFISVIDVFPDVIGCLLIWYALRRAEFFSPPLEEARRQWLKMALVAAADAVISYFLFSSNDQTLILLAVFVFRIAEAFMMYLAASKTFDGLVYLGTKFDGEGIYMHGSAKKAEKRELKEQAKLRKLDGMLEHEQQRYERATVETADEEHRHRATERYKHAVAKISSDASHVRKSDDIVSKLTRSTLIFIIIRTSMCVLPEFTVLSSGDISSPTGFNIARYRGLFVVLGAFVALIAAIVWAVKMIRYAAGIGNDKLFCREVRDRYEKSTVGQETKQSFRRMSASLLVLALGVILTFDLNIDNKNYIPDYIAAVFFAVFYLMLYRDVKNAKLGISLAAGYGVLSIAKTVLISTYIEKFEDFTRTYASTDARIFHAVCCVVTFFAEAVMIVLAVQIFKTLKELVSSHTGVELEAGEMTTDSVYAREALERENPRAFVLSVISSVMSVAWMIGIGVIKKVVSENEFGERVDYVPVFTPITVVTAIVSIVFILYTVKYISDINDEMKERFKYL